MVTEFCVKTDFYKICMIVIDIILTCGITYLVIQGICEYPNKYPKIFKIIYYVNCILWLIVGFANTLVSIIVMDFSKYCSNVDVLVILSLMGYLSLNIGYVLLYTFFLLRLKYTFDDYITKCTKIYLWSGIPIMMIVFLVAGWYFLPINNKWAVGLIIFGVFILIQYIYSGTILCLFIRNVFILLNKEENHTMAYSVIYSTVKYINCFSAALCTSLIGVIFVFIRSFNDSVTLWIINLSIIILDAFVNVLALNLQFDYMNKTYQCICGNKNIRAFRNVVDSDNTTTDIANDFSIQSKDAIDLAPTKSSKENEPFKLQPNSTSISESNHSEVQYQYLYFCRLCPIAYK